MYPSENFCNMEVFIFVCGLIRYLVIEAIFRAKWLGQDMIAKATGFAGHADYVQHLLNIRARIRENQLEY